MFCFPPREGQEDGLVKIQSTMVANKSTDGGNHSSTGSNESIKHDIAPQHHVTAPKGNPGKHAIKPELPYDTKQGTKDAASIGVSHGSFKGQCARTEVVVKHPNRKNDPAACKC